MKAAAGVSPQISPVRLTDLWGVNVLLNANLASSGDAVSDWFYRTFSLLAMPPMLLTAGKGYKAVVDGNLAGVVYVNKKRQSGYIFNLVTAARRRRQGVARALLRYVAAESRSARQQWLGLYVEAPNLGARQLYEAEGYRYYRPQGWRGRLPEPGAPGVALQAVSPLRERLLFQQFRDLELAAGDSWAADVVGADYASTLLASGRLFRCHYRQAEAGVLWVRSNDPDRRLTAELYVDPAWWADKAWVAGLLGVLAEKWGTGRLLDLFPGSGEHWQALAAPLGEAGFVPLERHRLLMLQQLHP